MVNGGRILQYQTLDNQFKSIKVGLQKLNDATLDLGSISKMTPKKPIFGDKKALYKALLERNMDTILAFSEFFYNNNGIYQKLCQYVAFMYRYDWYIVPEILDKEVKEEKILQDFSKMLNILDNTYIKKLCGEIALKTIVKGKYYGYLIDNGDSISIQELPVKYCRTRYSIKGMPAIICAGTANIPDGECFTAPIKNSVNGIITYNVPSPYHGEIFEKVSLTFKDGKIIHETSNNETKIKEILDTDEGSRYVGEFSLGYNSLIKEPMGDILYDEKIAGSIHFTPGCCYDECPNGNKSTVHWDLVLIQRPEYGGGEIYFDDILVRKDGLFVIDELKHLNYK